MRSMLMGILERCELTDRDFEHLDKTWKEFSSNPEKFNKPDIVSAVMESLDSFHKRMKCEEVGKHISLTDPGYFINKKYSPERKKLYYDVLDAESKMFSGYFGEEPDSLIFTDYAKQLISMYGEYTEEALLQYVLNTAVEFHRCNAYNVRIEYWLHKVAQIITSAGYEPNYDKLSQLHEQWNNVDYTCRICGGTSKFVVGDVLYRSVWKQIFGSHRDSSKFFVNDHLFLYLEVSVLMALLDAYSLRQPHYVNWTDCLFSITQGRLETSMFQYEFNTAFDQYLEDKRAKTTYESYDILRDIKDNLSWILLYMSRTNHEVLYDHKIIGKNHPVSERAYCKFVSADLIDRYMSNDIGPMLEACNLTINRLKSSEDPNSDYEAIQIMRSFSERDFVGSLALCTIPGKWHRTIENVETMYDVIQERCTIPLPVRTYALTGNLDKWYEDDSIHAVNGSLSELFNSAAGSE